LDKGSKPGNGVAVIAAFIVVVILLLAIPQVVLILIGLLTLGGFVVYSLDKSKKDSISNKLQAEKKPLPAPERAAKPPLPPPPPPPPLQQTTSSTNQKTSDIDDATERRKVKPIQSESLIGGKPLHADFLLGEKPAAIEPPVSRESGQLAVPKAGTPIPLVPTKDDLDELVSVVHAQPPSSVTFRVPRAPQSYGRGLWVPCGESITIGNTTIPGGMIYVGNSLKSDYGVNDPCLIDPSKPVAQHGDYTERQMGYWPSYSDISSTARRAYLNWLSDGRRDPATDIGFVFLFFYGLERRAIVDTLSDESAQADLPIIAEELRRLLSIYGGKSKSFNGYASEFLDWITLPSYPSRLYEQPLPELSRSFQLPLHLRLALGQAAKDGKPVPSSLALGWAKLERNITFRTPATRCPEEFDQLFLVKYSELFNQGLILPPNKTKLKLLYRPASAGFRARDSLIKVLDDIPDVTVLTAPIKKLAEVVEAATKDLEPFSRLMAKNPAARDTCEGLLRLPASLWPESSQKRLLQLKEKVGEGMRTMKYEDALYSLFEEAVANKDSIVPLARILESICVGIEPNVLLGAKPPEPADQIVLFAMPYSEVPTRTDGPFLVAELTLQLASAVAAADGDFSLGETVHLRELVNSWRHLTQGQKSRLLAHIEFLSYTPASLTPLKKRIGRFAIGNREMIAESMARVAHVDGDVSPDAIKVLEKIYNVLGVSASKVFSHLHVAASGSEASKLQVTGTAEPEGRFTLNRDRIAARQADTEKVQALLANIFSDSDETEADIVEDAPPPEPPPDGATGEMLLGLDQAHSTLARRMLARQEWSREDLLQMAAELDLMLDGALEHINDAAFDAYDMPFVENDDPVVLNAEVLGMLIT
jgi:uncharacterized tellurite resistance protein B-like protein